MNRRRFLKRAGIWVPAALAFPAIVRSGELDDPEFVASLTPPAATGPNTYYYTTTNETGNEQWDTGTAVWCNVVFAQAGTLTEIGIHVYTTNATTAKIALYDNAGTTLVASGSVALGTFTATPTWKDVTGLSAAVSAATYKLAVDFSNSLGYLVRETGAGTTYYAASAYADFPPANLPAASTEAHTQAMRAFVQ